MIECPHSMCPHHTAQFYPPGQAEPYCTLDKCVATEIQLKGWKEHQQKKREKWNATRKD